MSPPNPPLTIATDGERPQVDSAVFNDAAEIKYNTC